ncbi:hypothetical protein [Shewanella phage vB_SbaS_Y11]|nr:hypothetical protein [Shewanella phage vB_SbaS_Y11]
MGVSEFEFYAVLSLLVVFVFHFLPVVTWHDVLEVVVKTVIAMCILWLLGYFK